MSEDLLKRINRAVSDLVGNESLFADLGTEAAETALDWAIATTRHIVGETDGLDDAAAEAATNPRLRAVRQLIRLVNRIAAGGPGLDTTSLLDQVFVQAAILYGPGYQPPPPEQRRALPSPDLDSLPEWTGKLFATLAPPSPPEKRE
jgi:hypothetical protein